MLSAPSPRASCGLVMPCPRDLPSAVGVAGANGFDFAVVSIVHPRIKGGNQTREKSTWVTKDSDIEIDPVPDRPYALTRSDLILTCSDWETLLVGKLTSDPRVECVSHQRIRREAEERINRELKFCSHLGLSAVMVELNKPTNSNLARLISSYFLENSRSMIWARVDMNPTKSLVSDTPSDPWNWWNTFRNNLNYDKRLGAVLNVDKGEIDQSTLKRWLGEPVKALVVDTGLFLTNKKGFPVLPRSVQTVIREFIHLDVQIIIEGRGRNHNMNNYQCYIDHLWQQQNNSDPLTQYAKGFEDYLQTPLQPLKDNLDSVTYEVFEKDPVKYSEYQKAIYKAILDKVPNEQETKILTIMVLGAGRGPLVRASLEAAKLASRKVKVYAVEKNPNAIVTLMNHKEETWKDAVQVISSDMRMWNPKDEDKADIIVSELLGSFGDNELSPECLYSAQHLFKSDAISIPTSYTSWLGPLQSSKLYTEARNSIDRDKNPEANFETPYVVHLQNRTELAPPQGMFTFNHPEKGLLDNNRYVVKNFTIEMDSQLHGFGGYFECVLYKDVNLSINPATHSKGMFSWFPIFFPLKTPVKLKKGDDLEVHFWRVNNGKEVWYEWSVAKPIAGPIHNPNGRSYTIGL